MDSECVKSMSVVCMACKAVQQEFDYVKAVEEELIKKRIKIDDINSTAIPKKRFFGECVNCYGTYCEHCMITKSNPFYDDLDILFSQFGGTQNPNMCWECLFELWGINNHVTK